MKVTIGDGGHRPNIGYDRSGNVSDIFRPKSDIGRQLILGMWLSRTLNFAAIPADPHYLTEESLLSP